MYIVFSVTNLIRVPQCHFHFFHLEHDHAILIATCGRVPHQSSTQKQLDSYLRSKKVNWSLVDVEREVRHLRIMLMTLREINSSKTSPTPRTIPLPYQRLTCLVDKFADGDGGPEAIIEDQDDDEDEEEEEEAVVDDDEKTTEYEDTKAAAAE